MHRSLWERKVCVLYRRIWLIIQAMTTRGQGKLGVDWTIEILLIESAARKVPQMPDWPLGCVSVSVQLQAAEKNLEKLKEKAHNLDVEQERETELNKILRAEVKKLKTQNVEMEERWEYEWKIRGVEREERWECEWKRQSVEGGEKVRMWKKDTECGDGGKVNLNEKHIM